MEEPRFASFSIDVFSDRDRAKEVVTSVLCHIFWFRVFANLSPNYKEVLEVPIPQIPDNDLQTLVDQRVDSLIHQIDADSTDQNLPSGRGVMVVQFSERERKRRKGWFGAKGDEDMAWETWTLNVSIVSPRSQQEVNKTYASMETSLRNASTKILNIADQNKLHLPPITTQDTNTFPYQILVNPRQDLVAQRQDGWGQRMGIF